MIPTGITAEHVRLAVQDFDAKAVEHRFADSTRYDLLIEGRRYPPKAILGLAARYVTGEPGELPLLRLWMPPKERGEQA